MNNSINFFEGWSTSFLVTFFIITIVSISYLYICWSHRAYVRFIIMLVLPGIYYINIIETFYINGFEHFRGIDYSIINIIFLVIICLLGQSLTRNLLRPTDGTVLGGTELISAKKANRHNQQINKKSKILYPIVIGSVEIAHTVESQHFAICGTTGSGKTQAINNMLLTIRNRGKKAIIVDAGGGFISHFYTAVPNSKILNPFDQRSVRWSPFAEIRQDYDCQMIAKLTIPDGHNSSKEWNFYAQTLLAECLLSFYKRKNYTISELLYYILSSSQEELVSLISGTPAAILTMKGNEKMLINTRAVIANYINAWRCLPDTYNFSIRKRIQDEDDKSWLFISYQDNQIQELRDLVAMCLGISIAENLSLPQSSEREIWHIYDEIDMLGKVDSLRAGLTKFHKYGGRMVLGLQTISQLQETYGKLGAQTILANISTKLILRAGDNETASYFSSEIGEQDIIQLNQSYTDTSWSYTGTFSKSESNSVGEYYNQQRQLAMMPSEIMQLPEHIGILKTSTISPSIVGIPYIKLKKSVQSYQP